MAYLVIVRHGLSQANLDGIVAGHMDTPLTEKGWEQARETAQLLDGKTFDSAHASTLQRARHTLDEIIAELQLHIPVFANDDLKERSWGDIEGRFADNRDGKYSQEEIDTWFTWEIEPPSGESFAQVSTRVVGYFERVILPELKAGKNVLLVGHNGMLKTLRRHLEELPHSETNSLGFKNAEARLYDFDSSGNLVSLSSLEGKNN